MEIADMRVWLTTIVVLLAFAGRGLAADGSISAVAYRDVPPGAAIAVEPWDNSEETTALAREFEARLRAAGYVVDAGAPLVVSFETHDILGQWSTGERRSVLEIEGHGGRTGGEDASIRLNLFSSDRGGVFNEGRPPPDVVPSKYEMIVTLDHRDGKRYWQGQAVAELEKSSGFALTKSMVPALVARLGKTVTRESFPVD